jgi:hypothetical protein
MDGVHKRRLAENKLKTRDAANRPLKWLPYMGKAWKRR